MTSPASTLGKVAICLAFNLGAIVLAALQYWVWHDSTAAMACYMGLAMCGGVAAPSSGEVAQLKAYIAHHGAKNGEGG